MLKAAVVGGPSLVFTRKHEIGETPIRSHKYDLARLTKRIVGFNANSLYPSTMLQEMPCGKETVVHYEDPQHLSTVESLVSRLRRKQWFGFAEADIEVPRKLWERFEEFPPLFINRSSGPDAILQHMREYLTGSGRTHINADEKKLLGVLSEKKMLLYAPLLEWYLDQGLVVTAVYRTIDYMPQKLFHWFVHEVANKLRQGDADADKALLAEVFKLAKTQNELTWRRYEEALAGFKDMASNQGFRMYKGSMYTYQQRKLGLSAYYDKRWVLEDGIHIEPI